MIVIEHEPGLFVSDCGKAWSLSRGRIIPITPYIDSTGYLVVERQLGGCKQRWRIHRIIAEHFVPNPNGKPHVNHIDGNPTNSHCTNLEWVTHKENCRKGRNATITQEIADEIKVALTGHSTGREIAKRFGVSEYVVSNIKTGKTWC